METLTRQMETEQKLTPQGELNAANYRIRAEDHLGEGSLKQRCRDNFGAIELVRELNLDRTALSRSGRAAHRNMRIARKSVARERVLCRTSNVSSTKKLRRNRSLESARTLRKCWSRPAQELST